MKTDLWAGTTASAAACTAHGAGSWRRARKGTTAPALPGVRLVVVSVVLALGGAALVVAGSGRGRVPAMVEWPGVLLLGAGLATGATTAACAIAVRRRVERHLRPLEVLVASAAGVLPAPRRPDTTPAAAGLAGTVDTMTAVVSWLQRTEHLLAADERSPDLSLVVDATGLIRHASAAADSLLGRPAPWLTGKNVAALVHPDDRACLEDLRTRPVERGVRCYEELRLSHLHGHWVSADVTAVDITGPGESPDQRRVLHIRDVSDRKAHQESLARQALYDPLTGLANRALFREHVDKALGRLRRNPARPHAVLFVDLDGFKTVNDSLGHAAGDEVLAEVGRRMLRWLRPGETAARLGGDEFAVLLENSSEMDTALLAKRILDVLLTPIAVQGKEVVLSGSIGIALSEPGQDSEALLRNADAAMYTAKAAGKGSYRVFKPEMHHAAMRRLDLEADLRRAIRRDELFLAYQPIVDLATSRVTGVEVLVRWRHPERGLIPPLDFIAVAEDSGYIRPLGRFILEQACRQAREWQDRFPDVEPLRICVNASVRQIEQTDFFDEVVRALRDSGLDGRYLTLEITESLFMNDFGTGYSSLSYLRSLPIDILKIDQSFVAGVTHGAEQSAVARAIVKLARTFNLATVAEGVEHADQAAELLALGADMGQGYWFARPLAADAMEAYLSGSRLAREQPPGTAAPAHHA